MPENSVGGEVMTVGGNKKRTRLTPSDEVRAKKFGYTFEAKYKSAENNLDRMVAIFSSSNAPNAEMFRAGAAWLVHTLIFRAKTPLERVAEVAKRLRVDIRQLPLLCEAIDNSKFGLIDGLLTVLRVDPNIPMSNRSGKKNYAITQYNLYYCTSPTHLRNLLQHGANPNVCGGTRNYALCRCIELWNWDAFELLLEHGARLDFIVDRHTGETFLHYLFHAMTFARTNARVRDMPKGTPYYDSFRRFLHMFGGNFDRLLRCGLANNINTYSNQGYTPFHIAVLGNLGKYVKDMINYGADMHLVIKMFHEHEDTEPPKDTALLDAIPHLPRMARSLQLLEATKMADALAGVPKDFQLPQDLVIYIATCGMKDPEARAKIESILEIRRRAKESKEMRCSRI